MTTAQTTAAAPEKEFNTALTSVNKTFMPMIERQLEGNNIVFNEYAKKCVLNAISAINGALDAAGVEWNDNQLDKSNLTQVLLNVASLELNAGAQPSECYFKVQKVKNKDGSWKKKIEYGIQGAGYESVAARWGRNVKQIMPCWEVKEYDDFEYPKFTGLQFAPPTWTPKGGGEVIRVVYPVIYKDNTVSYIIAERGDVLKNLLAHINNNMMNATFGIAKDRYNATEEQKKQIDAKKAELKKRAKEIGFDCLDDAEIAEFISPAWKEYHSRESMFIRKMKNNAMKQIPKDFASSFTQSQFMAAEDEQIFEIKNEIIENTAAIPIEAPKEIEVVAEIQPETAGENTVNEAQVTLEELPGVFE